MRNVSTMAAFLFIVCGVAFASGLKSEPRWGSPAASYTLIVRPCDDKTPTNLEYFVEKKSYANENIRVFAVDTYGEPVCCSSHLVIYIPEKDQPMASKCFHVATNQDGLGFSGVLLSKTKATYNSQSGLTLSLPFLFYNPDNGGTVQKSFSLLINQADESVQIK